MTVELVSGIPLRYPVPHNVAHCTLTHLLQTKPAPLDVVVYSRTMSTITSPTWLRRIDSPIGRLELTSNGNDLTTLVIEREGQLPLDALAECTNRVLDRTARQLDEYFAGRRRSFSIPLGAHGTVFQHAIWDQLSELEWGEVTTYGELGMGTGRPTAGRAVGGAIGANPIPIIVPCHRVLGSDGRVTGYSGGAGIPTKLWLLEHEGILLAA